MLRAIPLAAVVVWGLMQNVLAAPIVEGPGEFVFVDLQGNPKKPIRVYYYRPQKFNKDGTVVFVMHGVSRNADGYRDVWSKYAEAKGFLILAPEFSQEHYSSARQYNLGYMYDTQGELRKKARWSFTSIEKIFDQTVEDNNLSAKDYIIYGHSAGGQFVHRFVLFMPEARYKLAIAANPGWYTMPNFQVAYPYGLKGTEVSPSQLAQLFERRLVLLLGQKDIDPNDENLTNTSEAKLQGLHRLARGKEFTRQSRLAAKELGVKLKWQTKIVPNAAHSNSKITAAAVKLVH